MVALADCEAVGVVVGEADPVALAEAPAVRVALALIEPVSEVCALMVELALADELDDVDSTDEAELEGVRELKAEPDEV